MAPDYIWEFCQLAGKLQQWPEQLLVHQFKAGLDQSLCQACAYQGLPPWLNEWYREATELDTELRECCPKGNLEPRAWRFPERFPEWQLTNGWPCLQWPVPLRDPITCLCSALDAVSRAPKQLSVQSLHRKGEAGTREGQKNTQDDP